MSELADFIASLGALDELADDDVADTDDLGNDNVARMMREALARMSPEQRERHGAMERALHRLIECVDEYAHEHHPSVDEVRTIVAGLVSWYANQLADGRPGEKLVIASAVADIASAAMTAAMAWVDANNGIPPME